MQRTPLSFAIHRLLAMPVLLVHNPLDVLSLALIENLKFSYNFLFDVHSNVSLEFSSIPSKLCKLQYQPRPIETPQEGTSVLHFFWP